MQSSIDVRSMLREQPSGAQPTVTTTLGALYLDRRVRWKWNRDRTMSLVR